MTISPHRLTSAATMLIALLVGCGEGGPVQLEGLNQKSPELPTEARPVVDATADEGRKLNCPSTAELDSSDPMKQWCVVGGFKHGPYMAWYDNGNRKESGSYAEGKLDGLWTEWFEDGVTHRSGFYKAGRKHGSWTTYGLTGNTESKGDFLNGREVGIWTFYHETGNRSAEGTFVNGIKDGKWRTWEDDGTPSGQTQWRSGKEVKE